MEQIKIWNSEHYRGKKFKRLSPKDEQNEEMVHFKYPFFPSNIIRYTGRPFETVEEMNRCLIKNWNDYIDADDQVFFLGDFGLGDVDDLHSICSQLKGHKIYSEQHMSHMQPCGKLRTILQ